MTPGWDEAKRILAVRLDAAGDVLMTTPALRALHSALPGRQITLLTSPAGAAVARLVPEVDDVIEYVAPWMKPAANDDSDEHLAMIEAIRRRRFDAAVIFTVYSQSPLPAATLACLAGIPLRLACCRENPYGLLTDWVRETEPEQQLRHEVRRQLDLVAGVGATVSPEGERLSLTVPEPSRRRVAALLDAIDRERPWAVVHVGASAPSRRYPYFGEVARGLVEEHGWQLVFTGGAGEAELVAAAREATAGQSLSLVGQLDLADLAALIEASPVLISNNTGPAHLAAAVGTPVVDLYALTNPQHAPWQVPHRLLFHGVRCAPCYRSVCPQGHHACLALVPPQAVVAAAVDLAAERSEVPARPRGALLLDADGVLLDTEGRHLDALLVALEVLRAETPLPTPPELAGLYAVHARGRDRYEGMASLLGAAGVSRPFGQPLDPPGTASACSLANLKNEAYAAALRRDGVPVMTGARDLMRTAKDRGFAVAVVSSSRNARHLLDLSGLGLLADVIVAPPDDVDLRRKPHPDPYLRAVVRLGVRPEDCVAVEDAESGVAAARAAGVGRVVGLATGERAKALEGAGADEVIDGLGRLLLLAGDC
ncbi:MAG: HAD-IA family hydrolase [Dehalococcoidia bacterium]